MPFERYAEPNSHPPQGRRHDGICTQCGCSFDSDKPGKRYGSLACYRASNECRENMQKAHQATAGRKNILLCVCGCGVEVHRAPSKVRGNVYATKMCRRTYFAARFDRFIASAVSLKGITNYDEFLSQNELPCLVDGCAWTGKNLSVHMNRSHGITAEQFKELAGFNRKTGVVSPDYAEYLSTAGCQHLPKADNLAGHRAHGRSKGVKMRPEGKEHYEKARALRPVERAGEGMDG